MPSRLAAVFAALWLPAALQAATYHVSMRGNDANSGTMAAPFRTIQHAADLAQPGDTVVVHAGIYRERVSPVRGGTSNDARIVYEAAPGEKVVISGSEPVTGWIREQGTVWKLTLPNSFFGAFNPFSDVMHGDWFNPMGWQHHTGAVYLNGDWLTEAPSLDAVRKGDSLWFAQVDQKHTIIWAQFKNVDPNRQRVEINVRQTVFFPQKTGISYITVRGFTLEDAATQWAPPTALQTGIIGPHWSKGWIIENNLIRNAASSCVSLGKYGDQWDNTSANSAQGYVETIRRALAHGWSKQNIGSHIVRNNIIYNCGQTGIVGSLGAAFSTITGNTIYNIHVNRTFDGAEIAGIKFHGAIDTLIARNNIYRTPRGLWLDWMAQGTRVSRNLFHDNDEDVFVEVDHGPFLIANNILLSSISLRDNSQGGAYVHNLFAGAINRLPYDNRQTPYLEPHATPVAGYHDNPAGDDRFFNNIFVKRPDLSVYDKVPLPMTMDGNVYLDGATPSQFDTHAVVLPDFDPGLQLLARPDGLYLHMLSDTKKLGAQPRKLVTSALLGKTVISGLPYEQPDGSPIRIDTDYFGRDRNLSNPSPGPFAHPGQGSVDLKIW